MGRLSRKTRFHRRNPRPIMFSPRLSKIVGDLWQNRGRTLLVILAIALGVFAISWISVTYSILVRELRNGYLAINPASSIITTDAFDADFIVQVKALPGVGEAEGARMIRARFQVGPDEWRTILLFVLADYSDNRINQLVSEEGDWPPPDGQILLERAALSIAKADIGDTLHIRVPGSETQALRVAGTVHDISLAPAWQEGMAYGYVTLKTLEQLGVEPTLNQLRLVVADDYFDAEQVRVVTNEVKNWVAASGRSIYQIRLPPPGEHPHADQMASLLMLQQAFGLLALVLSSALVANMISALLAQ